MPTLNSALTALETHCGFPVSRTRNVARRLLDGGILPRGAPGVAPQIDELNFVDLFIAVAADTTLRAAPEAVRTYGTLTPGGADLTGAPDRIPTARDELEILVEIALRGDDKQIRKSKIDVVSSWPEIAISYNFGRVDRFQPVGTTPDRWQSRKARKSTTIPGAAFCDAARATFGGNR